MQFDAAGAGPGLLVAMHDAGSWRAAGGGVASEQTMLRDAAEAVGEPTRDAGGKCMMLAGSLGVGPGTGSVQTMT
ncbi:hypothetical protein VTJ04DRAFT_9348 [Mycothermus thermophilus]|uniref:uncharacterized protein n=1 Tax=Humicola insolens TaxID=85995 RepID=UPI003743B486